MFSWIDFAVIGLYVLTLVGIGLYVSFRRGHSEDLFLAGRSLRWGNIGLSIFGTNVSPSMLIASCGVAYSSGLVAANFEWLAWGFLLLLAMIFIPHYLNTRITTMPEFLQTRYCGGCRSVMTWLYLVQASFLVVGGSLYVGSLILTQLTGWDIWSCIIGLALICAFLTVVGGLTAVVYTDSFQTILLIIVSLWLTLAGLGALGGFEFAKDTWLAYPLHLAQAIPDGMGRLLNELPKDYYQLLRPTNDPVYPWHAILLGYPVMGIWFWCTDQTIVQRVLGAKNIEQGQKGCVFAAYLKILSPLIFFAPGLLCFLLHPGLGNGDTAYVTMVKNYLPVGGFGLVTAVMMAALISTVDSGMNSLSTVFTYDIYKNKMRPDASEAQLKQIGRWTVGVVTLIGIGSAILFKVMNEHMSLFDLSQSIGGFTAPALASVFLVGVLWKGATARGALVTLITGISLSLIIAPLYYLKWPYDGFFPHFLLCSFYMFAFLCVLMVIVSWWSRHGAEEHEVPSLIATLRAKGNSTRSTWVHWLIVALIMLLIYVASVCKGYGEELPASSSPRIIPQAELQVLLDDAMASSNHTAVLSDGYYRVDKPLRLDAAYSGLRVTAAPGAHPIVGTGTRYHFSKDDNGTWYFDVPLGTDFKELYINGRRAQVCRSPNRQYYYMRDGVVGAVDPLDGVFKDMRKRAFIADPSDIAPLLDLSEEELENTEIRLFFAWTAPTIPVAGVDKEQSMVLLKQAGAPWEFRRWDPFQRYLILGNRASFDAAGEWFFDRAAGRVLYKPLLGETLSESEAWVPGGSLVLDISGSTSAPATGIQFDGITFAHGDSIPLTASMQRDYQAGYTLPGFIEVQSAEGIVFSNCVIRNQSVYGIRFGGQTRNCTVADCEITDFGAGAVRIGEALEKSRIGNLLNHPAFKCSGHRIENNLIYAGGRVYPGGVAIFVAHASDNRIINNTIFDTWYAGVSLGWIWDYTPITATNNWVLNNEIHHCMQGVLSDGAGIYTLGNSPGTCIAGNVIHDIVSYSYGGHGIYGDQGSSQMTVENNLVFDTSASSFMLHYGRAVSVENNIFAFADEGAVSRVKYFVNHKAANAVAPISLTAERNIVLLDGGDVLEQKAPVDHVSFNSNLYWQTDGKLTVGGLSFFNWQETGQDADSLVADPGFRNAQSGDFSLEMDSPAVQIGFKPFNVSAAGVQGALKIRKDVVLVGYPFTVPSADPAKPEPTPLRVDEDLEQVPDGSSPKDAKCSAERSTLEVISINESEGVGKRTLYFKDRHESQSWMPALTYKPGWEEGTGHVSFQMKVADTTVMNFECRNEDNKTAGPEFYVRNGGLYRRESTTEPLMKLPLGEFVEVDVQAPLGEKAGGSWTLTVKTLPGKTLYRADQACNSKWNALARVVWFMPGEEGELWLDHIRIYAD